MSTAISLSQLRARGVTFGPHEAVAIAQSLIHRADISAGAASRPFGPPALDTVVLRSDGSVVCTCSDATPAVSEIAILLQSMLPPGVTRVPGGLRYAIGRALLEVDAPPFDSLDDFSRTLARYEQGEREDVIRRLLDRREPARVLPHTPAAPAAPAAPVSPVSMERRRAGAHVDELRRQLRAVDRQQYEHLVRPSPRVAVDRPARWRRPALIAAGLAAAIVMIAVGELVRLRRSAAPRA